MAVPDTSLTLTDRLAVKLYATNSGGKTTTIHTQDGHLCQVITTFSTGITALNGLTAQVQYFQVGTSGTDFNISSTTATHTFNIPDASATARGLITTGTQTIAGTKTFNDATKNNGGIFLQNASSNSLAGYMNIGGLTNGVKFTSGGGISNTFTLPSATGYTFTFPSATGTIALTSDLTGGTVTSVAMTVPTGLSISGSPITTSGTLAVSLASGYSIPTTSSQATWDTAYSLRITTASLPLVLIGNLISMNQATALQNGFLTATDFQTFRDKQNALTLTTTGTSGAATLIGATLNIPNYAPDLSGYVTLAGTQTITGAKTFSTFTKFDGGVILKNNVSASLAGYVGISAYSASGNKGINIDFDTYSNSFYFSGSLPYQYTFPAASGTIALVGGSGVGTVTSVAALTIGTSGTDLSSTVATSTTTPVITLNVPTASAANRGALSSADWSTFNSKQAALTNPVTGTGGNNYIAKFTSTGSTIGNSLIQDDGSTIGLGIAPIAGAKAYVYGTLAVRSGYGVQWGTNGYNLIYGDQTTNELYLYTNNVQRLLIASTGAATFSSTLRVNGGELTVYSGASIMYTGVDTGNSYAYIGTNTTSYGLSFQASGERMRIFSTGNISISSSPSDAGYKLDVNGTGRFTSSVTATDLIGVDTLNITASNVNTNGTVLTLNSKGTVGVMAFQTASTERMRINASGLVQINHTNTAKGNLDVASDVNAVPLVIRGRSADGEGQVEFWNYAGSTRYGVLGSTSNYSYFGSIANTPLYFLTNSTERMRITSGGVVQIANSGGTLGTIVGSERLNVNGDVYAYGKYTGTSFFESSDMRIKTLIQDNYQTKGIASITPKLYTKNGKVELGYYAQDLVGILDSAVSKGSDEMLSLSYREVLVAKVYALEQEIKELKAKMN
jgi:hypothetical protein